jgi:hypothetical protein
MRVGCAPAEAEVAVLRLSVDASGERLYARSRDLSRSFSPARLTKPRLWALGNLDSSSADFLLTPRGSSSLSTSIAEPRPGASEAGLSRLSGDVVAEATLVWGAMESRASAASWCDCRRQ